MGLVIFMDKLLKMRGLCGRIGKVGGRIKTEQVPHSLSLQNVTLLQVPDLALEY